MLSKDFYVIVAFIKLIEMTSFLTKNLILICIRIFFSESNNAKTKICDLNYYHLKGKYCVIIFLTR